MADWDVVSSAATEGDPWGVVSHESHTPVAPKEGDAWPEGKEPPKGFYAVTEDGGRKSLRHEWGMADVVKALSDLPGVGMAERLGQGVTRLGGKVASGIAGMVGGPDTVRQVQGAVNNATELPPSNDPLVQGMSAAQGVAEKVAAPVDRAVGNLPPGPRTSIEGVEEAVPDVAALAGFRGALPAKSTATNIARTPAEVSQAAGYTGLRTRADLLAPGNRAITDTLISKDAGIVPGHPPSVAALENAIKVGPGRVYHAAEQAIPEKLTQDAELKADLGNLPNQVSQLPRSPDVDALQETMLSQENMTRDELFANIREARERAKAHWKSDDPDKGALGDAYASLAHAYEGFVDRQLQASGAETTLADWQQARVQMAKNYQAQGALRGEHFDARVYGQIAERNPHLLTDNAAIVGHVANGLPASATAGMSDVVPGAGGALAGEALGQHMGVPGVGALTGAVAVPMIRAKLADLLRRGRPDLAAQTSTNPELSYFFNREKMPEGWNRSPVTPQIAGLLPSPSMVNAGGGASTPSTLESLGLTPDIQAAGAQHPGAARLQALREQVSRPPMPEVDLQGPQKWGDFSIAPPNASAPQPGGIPFENVLEQGGTQRPPVGAPAVTYRPPSKSPKGAQMRTPPGAPTLTDAVPTGPSDAQLAERSRQAAARLRKVAGDLRVEGPGNATGSPIDRLRAALLRRERGYAKGGSVDPRDFTARYNTALTPPQEQQFQAWARGLGKQGSSYDYDLRGAWLNGAGQAANGHFPDTYKKPNHPTFSDQSQYSGVDGYSGGQWQPSANGRWAYIPSESNLKMHSPEELTQYFKRVEPTNQLALPPMDEDERESFAGGGEVVNFAEKGVQTLLDRINHAFGNPYTADLGKLRQDISKYWTTAAPATAEAAQATTGTPPAMLAPVKEESLEDIVASLRNLLTPGAPEHLAGGGRVELAQKLEQFLERLTQQKAAQDTAAAARFPNRPRPPLLPPADPIAAAPAGVPPEGIAAATGPANPLQPGFLTAPQAKADGGSVEDTRSSIRRLADAARALGVSSEAEPRARVATNLASLGYGLDAQGNPALGGRAWTPSQGGTPAGILDALTATPHNLVALVNLLNGPGPKGTSAPHLQWSDDAAARLGQLRQRLQKAAGVAPAQSLGEAATDAVTDPALVAPMGVAKLAGEGSTLGKFLNWGAGGTEDSTHAAQGAH